MTIINNFNNNYNLGIHSCAVMANATNENQRFLSIFIARHSLVCFFYSDKMSFPLDLLHFKRNHK